MKANDSHLAVAKTAFEQGKRSAEVKSILQSEGLTKSQSNDVMHRARKKLGIYKKKEEIKKMRDTRRRSKKETDE